MKLLTSLIAITALTLASAAFAQEEETTSTPAEEQPATTIEETPATSAPAVETSTPAPMETTTPAPAMTSTPKPKAEAPAATATPAKATSTKSESKKSEKAESSSTEMAAPAPSGKKMSVEATLKDNENRWASAAAKHDVKLVEGMVAEDYIGINSKGKTQNRRAMLSEMKGDKDVYTMNKNEKLDVRKYGANVAVVVGTYRERGTGKDGKAFDRSYRFTDTWVERNGQWKCVAGQSMLLGKK